MQSCFILHQHADRWHLGPLNAHDEHCGLSAYPVLQLLKAIVTRYMEMSVMMVVLSNATRLRLMAVAEEYQLSLPTPISSTCGSVVSLEDVRQTIRSLQPLTASKSSIRDLVHVLTEASQHLDPIIPCDEVSPQKQDVSLWLSERELT